MKRKKLQESPSDSCICGHTREQHYQSFYEQNPIIAAKMKKSHGSYFNEQASGCAIGWNIKSEEYCHCDKYLDIRHCKIKIDDPVLQYCKIHGTDLIQAELVLRKVGSMATVSRRFTLFKFLGLLHEEGFSPIGIYSARAMAYGFDAKAFNKLIDEGIIQ
jgi:hypothetical protein